MIGKTTIAGRVVYDRKLHPFSSSDALRIVKAVANVGTGEPEGDPMHWRAIARYAANAFLILDPAAAYEENLNRPLNPPQNKMTGEVTMPSEFYSAATFVHYVQEISNIVGKFAGYVPFVKTVWEIASPILEAAARGAQNALGNWQWSEKENRPIFYP